jgi:FkbM family methyltransferase
MKNALTYFMDKVRFGWAGSSHRQSRSDNPPEITARSATLFNGRTMYVDENDTLGIATNGIFETDETLLCQSLLRPGDRVLDVGANMGYYTVLFAEWAGPEGKIFAVEPHPSNLSLLELNTIDFRETGRVTVLPYAFSDHDGSEKLYLSKGNVGMHRLYPSVCCHDEWASVDTRKGDDFSLAPLDFIKIDVEGFEFYAMRGLEQTLRHSPNVKILCEFSPLALMEGGSSPLEFMRWMFELGFEAQVVDGGVWRSVAVAELLPQLERLECIDKENVITSASGKDAEAVADLAMTVCREAGYTRPILENFLFVRL